VKWASGGQAFDEIFERAAIPRTHYRPLVSILESFTQAELDRRERLQKLFLIDQGITFTIYGEQEGVERIFPFDFVPRVIPASEWHTIERGLIQRITALNLFIFDIYSAQRCLKDGVIPASLVFSRPEYKRELLGIVPAHRIFTHIVGTDIVRDDQGQYRVLEDNCRCPSGVSYVLENRNLLNRVFPEFFTHYPVRPIKDYPHLLLDTLRHSAPRASDNPVTVVLTPGLHNSAFFEHSFLTREMGVALVEGHDLIVEDNTVYMRTTRGKQKVDVIYRRIDDDFLDPLAFRRDSLLGVPGLINVYREGNVALANAPGAGVADDKAVYAYVPKLIEYYMSEAPILPQVPTFVGLRPDDFTYMTEHAHELVIKTTGDSGGYNMLMGPFTAKKEIQQYVAAMRKNPGNYIAQPLVELSTHPTYVGGHFQPRRIDLRPFVLYGESVRVLPGGLTRVALRADSYVVNSSQGGGSKDTWVLAARDR
jgi:uncharacterized circularly permuted ATP-grasp superfamily protein